MIIIAAGCVTQVSEKWKGYNAGPFVFSMPSDFQKTSAHGIDSYVEEFTNKDMVLSFDYGPYSGDPLENEGKDPQYNSHLEIIASNKVQIVTFDGDLHFPEHFNRNILASFFGVGLTMQIACATNSDYDKALRIFRSVRFTNVIVSSLVFELRIPQTQRFEPKTQITLASQQATTGKILTQGAFLQFCTERTEKPWRIFQRNFILNDEAKGKRTLIVSPFILNHSNIDGQVFLLSIPRHPKPKNFSPWQRPNFIASNPEALIYGLTNYTILKNIPLNCFELRYKIESEARSGYY
jgi:hypothetical protein